MPANRRIAIAMGVLAATSTAIGAASCDDAASSSAGPGSSSTSGGGGGGGGDKPDASIQTFTPQGCAFEIAPRPEYKDFRLGSDATKPDPKIRRVRLGLGGRVEHGVAGRADPATSSAFAWQTDDGTLASDVAWGSNPDPAKWSAKDRTSGVTWLTPEVFSGVDQRMHEAYVCGLSPETTYYYRVGGGAAGKEVWSEVHAFTTTPSNPDTPVTFGVTGDSREELNDAWRLIQTRLRDAGVTMQLFSGDVINFAPNLPEWDHWLDSAWKDGNGSLLTLGQILTLPAHGNHESHTNLYFGNFTLPQDPKFPSWGELFFSVDVGPVHVIVFDDSYVVSPDGDPAFKPAFEAWLRKDLELANQNRGKIPWIVAVHHHAEFSSSKHGSDTDVLRGRDFFVPIWDEYHLDLALLGHDHNYERSKILNGPARSPTIKSSFAEGTVYVVCAGSGAPAYSAGTSPFTEVSRDYTTGGALGFYGFLKATKNRLELAAHELRADGSDPIIDTFTITK